jgi:hypothetical protein
MKWREDEGRFNVEGKLVGIEDPPVGKVIARVDIAREALYFEFVREIAQKFDNDRHLTLPRSYRRLSDDRRDLEDLCWKGCPVVLFFEE